ncbi:MAG TPA: rhodanese-like domain-containing protein [Coleofasciculaceae cyanobacterium]|jgi:rhodanese-related sulfurtransferase
MMSILDPNTISAEEFSKIIDVREPDEFLQEHIPGSRNIPLGQITQAAAQLRGQSVILSCRSGRRAEQAKSILEAQGCRNLLLLAGGLSGWKGAKKPTTSLKKGYSIMQQVQMVAGTMILLGSFVKTLWFLAPLAGLGLLTAGLTNTCMMATLLSRMPWNRIPKEGDGCSTGNCSLP